MPISGSSTGSSGIVFLNESTGYILPALITGNAATYSQTLTTVTVTSTGHNVPATIHNGRNVYLAIGTVSTGVAPTGYTTGWFSNFTYVDANTFTCTATNSQSGTGAVNTTITAITLPLSGTLSAGALGLDGSLNLEAFISYNNSAGAKTFRCLFGGSIWTAISGTTSLSSYIRRAIRNRGNASKQVSPALALFTGGSSGSSNSYFTVNTAADVAITHTLQSAVASDYVALDALLYTVNPA